MNVSTPAKKARDPRTGLRTSATLATVFTTLGLLFFGFEQAVAAVGVALLTGYTCAFAFEAVDAWATGRAPGWAGGGAFKVVDWLLSAHMTSITISFLLFAVDDFWVIACTVALAIGSKYVFRVRTGDRYKHFMNPSNFGIALAFLLFPWLGALPWGFTVNTHGWVDWFIPLFIVGLGFRLNLLFTKRLPLIGAWLTTFFLQGLFRSVVFHEPFAAQVAPITGIALILFSFYMITDPQTSPTALRSQIVFGVSVGVLYGVFLHLHLNYFFFFAVSVVCAVRGLYLALEQRGVVPTLAPMPVASAVGSARPA